MKQSIQKGVLALMALGLLLGLAACGGADAAMEKDMLAGMAETEAVCKQAATDLKAAKDDAKQAITAMEGVTTKLSDIGKKRSALMVKYAGKGKEAFKALMKSKKIPPARLKLRQASRDMMDAARDIRDKYKDNDDVKNAYRKLRRAARRAGAFSGRRGRRGRRGGPNK